MIGLLVGGLLFLGAAGCGQKELSKRGTYPVTGTVTWKGEPVHFVGVELEPTEKGGSPAVGFVGADGTFTLRTYSNEDPDGAIPGTYTVTLKGYNPTEHGGIPEGSKPTAIPGGSFKTEVTVEVLSEDNHLTIEIP